MGCNGTEFAERLLEVAVSHWIKRLSGTVIGSGTASKLMTASASWGSRVAKELEDVEDKQAGLERGIKTRNSRWAFGVSSAPGLAGTYPAVTCLVVLAPTNTPAGGVLFPCWLFCRHLGSLGNCKQRFRTLIKSRAPMRWTLCRY